MPVVSALPEEPVIPMIAADAYVPENLPPPKYGRSHVCTHDGAARTHICIE